MGVNFSKEIGIYNVNEETSEAKKKLNEKRTRYLQTLLETEDKVDSSQDSAVKKNVPIFLPEIHPENYDYPFESLVFQGSGYRGVAYCGAVNLLEELGLLKNIKKFCGSSWGAIAAALLAAGYNAKELENEMSRDYENILYESYYGGLSRLSNMFKGYGWYSGHKFYDHIGSLLANKCGDPDITFSELYELTDKELCIVVTNVNMYKEEYCHVKTNPNMPVRIALHMSISAPGVCQPIQYSRQEEKDFYVEGGFLCNYPIHSFDGWYLSMDPDHGFIKMLQPLDKIPEFMNHHVRFEYFSEKNKTIGLMVFHQNEHSPFRQVLEGMYTITKGNYPDSKISREYLKRKNASNMDGRAYERTAKAVESFYQVLQKNNIDQNELIDKSEFENAVNDADFSKEDFNLLFGEGCTVEEAFEALDEDSSGDIEVSELLSFMESNGVALFERFLYVERQEFNGVAAFIKACGKTMSNCVDQLFLDTRDTERTVGINTGYINESRWDLSAEDKEYLISQGRRSMENYLKFYAAEKKADKQ